MPKKPEEEDNMIDNMFEYKDKTVSISLAYSPPKKLVVETD